MREYQRYMARLDRRDQAENLEILNHIEVMSPRPKFYVLVGTGQQEHLEATIESCAQQIYAPEEVFFDRSRVAIIDADHAYLMLLSAGDCLHPRTLYEYASLLSAEPQLQMIYCDDDILTDSGLSLPFVKPDWSPDYFEAFDFVRNTGCFSVRLARDVLPESTGDYDFALRFTEKTSAIGHIKRSLIHKRVIDRQDRELLENEGVRALAGRLARTNRSGCIEPSKDVVGCFNICVDRSNDPFVSIVIPTAGLSKDVDGQLGRDLILECVKSIVNKSSYSKYEIVIVRNLDFDRSRLSRFADRVRFVTYVDKAINIAKKLNMGAACAAGEYLILMNDDTEVITADWIERMLAHFEKPHVGVVAPKLLYPDHTIQHAGVVSIVGQPMHVDRGVERDDPGYFASNSGPRNFIAMTGAVTMVRAKTYQHVGGYSEDMPIYYNDIDFSYKMHAAGFYLVYEPAVELIHYESLSWTGSDRQEHRLDFESRWGKVALDPFYNYHLLNLDPPRFQFSDHRRLF